MDRKGKVIWKKFESGIFGNKKCFFAGEQVQNNNWNVWQQEMFFAEQVLNNNKRDLN